jgi:hypothetical protein
MWKSFFNVKSRVQKLEIKGESYKNVCEIMIIND